MRLPAPMHGYGKLVVAVVLLSTAVWLGPHPVDLEAMGEETAAAYIERATTTTEPPSPATMAPGGEVADGTVPTVPATTAGSPVTAPPPATTATTAGPPGNGVPRAPAPPAALNLPPLTPPPVRDLSPYRGLGTWVDVYDFSPEYQSSGRPPPVTPATIDEMAEAGVRTVYLQAAKDDFRSPGLLVNPELLGEMLTRAHARGLQVVAWYLPKFYDLDSDMRRLIAMRDFRWAGEGFDGIGLDIEWRRDVPDHAERNQALIELSRRLREAMGDAAVAAIPLPPVLIEAVNPNYWPDFPWREIAPYYDVWLPMAYWTFRTQSSGYKDGYVYTDENIRRLRANLGQPDAPVHPIGGTDNKSTDDDYRGFVRACAEHGCVGGSIYDWDTTPPPAWDILRAIPG